MLRERREAGAEERNGGAQRRGATEERSGGRSFNGGQKQVDKGGEWKIKYSYRSGQGDGEERQTAAEDRRGGSPRRPELRPRSALEENR